MQGCNLYGGRDLTKSNNKHQKQTNKTLVRQPIGTAQREYTTSSCTANLAYHFKYAEAREEGVQNIVILISLRFHSSYAVDLYPNLYFTDPDNFEIMFSFLTKEFSYS